MGNCHPSKTKVNLSFASVDISFLRVTIPNVTFSRSQFLYNITRRQAISPFAKFHPMLGRGFMIQWVMLTLNQSESTNLYMWKYNTLLLSFIASLGSKGCLKSTPFWRAQRGPGRGINKTTTYNNRFGVLGHTN